MAAMLEDLDDFSTAGKEGKDKRLRHICTRRHLRELALSSKWDTGDLERMRDHFHEQGAAELDFERFRHLLE